eukprot:CAMPEP_0195543280 /NCGR_PEP_ID=MMETSP0794_2-20130614/52038_1 /TAXON_ID=515487 /ORGANISM="Stephanopyxis turris, Strain CCMP 815" /LENGTH=476 /DNA_ID=CAMNT_0040677437 /DNA_START=62 /DNA_END=1492 /DNA_ORIENTATION=-
MATSLGAVIEFGFLMSADAYLVYPGLLPPQKHTAWLQTITRDICDSKAGHLTPEMVDKVPQLMSAWAYHPHSVTAPMELSPGGNVNPVFCTGKQCAIATEQLLKRLLDERQAGKSDVIATTSVYNSVLTGWARSGEGFAAAERAENILREMEYAYEMGDENVQPNRESFKIAIEAWTQSGAKDSIERSIRILEWTVDLIKSGKNLEARIDTESFDLVFREITNSRNVTVHEAKLAEGLLNLMEEVCTCTKGFETVNLHTSCYIIAIHTWTRSRAMGSARRSVQILQRMAHLYIEGHNNIVPDAVCFNYVFDALAKSGELGTVNRAKEIFQLMKGLYQSGCIESKPDVFSYSSLLSVCAYSKGDKNDKFEAFEFAMEILEEIGESDSVFPNHVTYGTALRACTNLLPICMQRQNIAEKIFNECRKNGQVNGKVLSQLRYAVSPKMFRNMIGDFSEENFPIEWGHNVQMKKRKGRKKD